MIVVRGAAETIKHSLCVEVVKAARELLARVQVVVLTQIYKVRGAFYARTYDVFELQFGLVELLQLFPVFLEGLFVSVVLFVSEKFLEVALLETAVLCMACCPVDQCLRVG